MQTATRLAALTLFALGAAAFAGLDVRVGNGDTVAGTLDPGAESETLRAVIPKDALISVAVKGLKRRGSSDPAPVVAFALVGPDDQQVGAANTKARGTGASLKKEKALLSGEYRVVVTGDGTAGDYSAVISWASRKSFALPLQLAGDPKRFEFVADANATATFRVSAGKGNALPRLFELHDAEDAAVHQFAQPAPGAKTHTEKNVPLGAGGTLTLLVTDAGGGDPFLGSVTVKPPKPLKRKLVLTGGVLPPLNGNALAAVLGPEGGLLEASNVLAIDGASVSIPPGALAGATAIIVGESAPIDPDDVTIESAGPSVFFGPEGLTFLAGLEATIRIPYDDGAYPGGAGLRVFTRDADGVVTEVTPVTVDPNTSSLVVATSHFSSFQGFGTPPSVPLPVQDAKLFASGGESGDRFGFSCAVSTPRLVVGEFFGEVAGGPVDAGTARVFLKDATGWREESVLQADSPAADQRFGESVGIEGDTVVVGASQIGITNAEQGAAIVYTRDASEWAAFQELTAPDPVDSGHFGGVVAISVDTIAVGCTQAKDPLNRTVGAVYIFRFGSSQWEQEAKLIPADAQPFGGVGSSVALDGDTVAFGRGAFGGGNGAVWIYTRSGTTWTFQQKLEAAAPAPGDAFGRDAIALRDDTLAVAVPRTGQTGSPPPEVAIFDRSGGTWSPGGLLAGPRPALFGNSLGLIGDRLLVGAPLAGGNVGSVALYKRGVGGFAGPFPFVPGDSASGQNFGNAIAVDGSHFVVASIAQNGFTGAVYVFGSGL